ncbi:hypothetical protein ABN098_19610, partial [Proteus terrae]
RSALAPSRPVGKSIKKSVRWVKQRLFVASRQRNKAQLWVNGWACLFHTATIMPWCPEREAADWPVRYSPGQRPT